ncbi:MAG TPA: PepSY domain-containing protein [Terrimicrobiaceae bacterium]
MIRPTVFVGILAAVALVAQGALAAEPTSREDRPATSEERARVTEALEKRGYKNVHSVEVDDGRFEADATSPAGYEVDLELDMNSLDIVHEHRD